jgi:predicted transcriptional regulator
MESTIEHQYILNNIHQIYQYNQQLNVLLYNQHNYICLNTSNYIAEICSPTLFDSSNIFMKIFSKDDQQLIKTLSIESFAKRLPYCKIFKHKKCATKSKLNPYSCSTINVVKVEYRENKIQSGCQYGHPDNKPIKYLQQLIYKQ